MSCIKKSIGFLLIVSALVLVGCSEGERTTISSSESTEESLKSESVNELKATYNLESGKETAEFFRAYFGSEMMIQPYEFDEEQEINYMYPSIFTVTADAANDTVRQITFFEVDEEDSRMILKKADFATNPLIEEALAFEGNLKEPNFGDNYSSDYDNDLGLGVSLLIKGSMWEGSNDKPYSLTLFYDKKAYDKYVD
ncbi:hypothetical protein [Carnobacterium sp. TMP28]|uniref:hypothetical protein n=1 Tax=Carnobacterium sp. TMP28 TaxID=3397060 RepID=UPI0039E06CE8